MKETTDKKGHGQATDILKSLEESDLDPNKLAFQSYDFAPNMSGASGGAQALLSEKLGREIQ